MLSILSKWLESKGMSEPMLGITVHLAAISGILLIAFLANLIAKRLILKGLAHLVKRSQTAWDDILLENKVFERLSQLAPALVIYLLAPLAFPDLPNLTTIIERFALACMLLVGMLFAGSLLDAAVGIYRTHEISRHKPIKGYVQVAKLVVFFTLGILALSIILNRSPVVFLGSLGALTAVLLLVFKDTILGFVASIQLAANNMVRRDDWIEMPKYGADGDVIDVTLTTVKVRNWDKTVTTIPTYALIADSFKNWRGMSESGGRRIKRAIRIDINTIRFCNEEMLERFKKFQFITEYVERKIKEVSAFNQEHDVDESELINGRRLTNIGTFRAYVEAYLRNHPMIHQEMTFLVRQLAPTEHGLPIEIYVFSKDQRWASYEAIQADIFDHILAIVPEFDLKVFQDPAGSDFRTLTTSLHSHAQESG